MSENLSSNLIRAYVDDEVSPEERSRVEKALDHDADLRRRFEFERSLRSHVGRAMASDATEAPQPLRERIAAAFDQPHEDVAAASVEPEAEYESVAAVADDHDGSSVRPRSQPGLLAAVLNLFGRPQQVSYAAIAGVAVLLTAVILIGVLSPSIDQRAQQHDADLVGDISEWIAQEHDRCAQDEDALKQKLRTRCRQSAAHQLYDHLAVDHVSVFDLSEAGYVFVGEGACGMPGAEASAHLIYRREVEGKRPAILSIFVMPNKGQLDHLADGGMVPGQWYEVECRTKCRRVVRQCTDSRLSYFVVTCDPRDLDTVSETISRSLVVSRQ